MPTMNEAKEAALKRFLAQTTLPADRRALPNMAFEPPAGVTWVRISIQHIGGEQSTLNRPGLRRFERRAIVFMQVMAPVDQGSEAGDLLAQECRDIFEGTSFDGLRFTSVDVREVPSDDDAWWTTLVEAPFDYEEVK